MKIFGSVYPFVESKETSLKLGRHVANYDFFKALIRYSSFDEFHIFCLNVSHYNLTKNRLLQEDIPQSQKSKIKLYLLNHLVDQIRIQEYYVFHLGGWGYFFPGLVYLRNKYAKNKFPITGLIHSLNGIETNYHGLKMCNAPLLPYDTIICSSKSGQKVVQNIFSSLSKTFSRNNISISFKGKTTIIPLGIDENFLNKTGKMESRKSLSIPENNTVLLHLGRLSPQTKADLYPLIKTFRRLQDNNPTIPLSLILAGGASTSEKTLISQIICECGIEDSVFLITNFDDTTKKLIYGASDIFVSLSDNLQETFGISIIEAMGSQLPVVVSDLNGYSELVSHNETGFKINTLWTDTLPTSELADLMNFDTMQLMLSQCMVIDTEQLFDSLNKLIEDNEFQKTIGNNACKVVKNSYLWKSIIKDYEILWEDLFSQSVKLSEHVECPENPFRTNYTHQFSHYPTHILQSTNICSLTDAGQKAIDTLSLPLPYTDISPLIDNTLALNILIKTSAKATQVQEIHKTFGQGAVIESINYILLWMAKYGLLHIINQEGDSKNTSQMQKATKKQESEIIAVTGMHRSGTSSIAGLLGKCGFSLGPEKNLLNENKPKFDNVKGHFENHSVVMINENILQKSNGSWFELPQQNNLYKAGEALAMHITSFNNSFEGTIIKDPRLCLTLDTWKQFCPRLKSVIICFRHPLGVAHSLKKRNHFPLEFGLNLWYEYNVRLIDSIESIPVTVVNYDSLTHNLGNDLYNIITMLKSPLSKEKMLCTIEGFFDSSLNHNKYTEEELNEVPKHIQELYTILKSNSVSSPTLTNLHDERPNK